MWLLVALAVAADPPPVVPDVIAPTPSCQGAQRCGAACISWVEPCREELDVAVAASIAADRERQRQELLCVGSPVRATPPKSVATAAALAIVAGYAEEASRQSNLVSLADARSGPADHAPAAPPPVSTPAPCGPPTIADDRSR